MKRWLEQRCQIKLDQKLSRASARGIFFFVVGTTALDIALTINYSNRRNSLTVVNRRSNVKYFLCNGFGDWIMEQMDN